MHRFCGTLSLNKDVQKAATCIAKKAVDLDIVPGRSPISVAAAAIYMASQVTTYDKCNSKFPALYFLNSIYILVCQGHGNYAI